MSILTIGDRDQARSFLQQIDGYAPTDEQLDAILAPHEPALIVAGAGSGKTKVMALRVVYHVVTGQVQPNDVLGLTFTKKAAGELAERVERYLARARTILDMSGDDLSRPLVSTYNSFAAAIARDYALLIGEDPDARLINDGERWQLAHRLVSGWTGQLKNPSGRKIGTLTADLLKLSALIIDHDLDVTHLREQIGELDEVLSRFSKPKKHLGKFQDYRDGSDLRPDLLTMVEEYHRLKKVEGVSEFSDQVSWANRIVRAFPHIAKSIREQYSFVLLDEYQDTSVNQAQLLHAIFGNGHNVVAVGDPNQAIYSWRGASANSLASFRATFGTRDHAVRQYTLETAFRNSPDILAVANRIAEPLAKKSGNIDLPILQAPQYKQDEAGSGSVEISFGVTEAQEYAELSIRVSELMQEWRDKNDGHSPEVAVLCRARATFDPINVALEDRGLETLVVGATSFTQWPEVLNVRALCRSVVDPSRGDELMRLLNLQAIGASDLEALGKLARRLAKGHIRQVAEDLGINTEEIGVADIGLIDAVDLVTKSGDDIDVSGLTNVGRQRIKTIGAWIRSVREAHVLPLGDQVYTAMSVMGLPLEAMAQGEKGGESYAALQAFVTAASKFESDVPGATLASFLDWVDVVDQHEHGSGDELPLADIAEDLDGASDQEKTRPGRVTIMTMHAAKGLEWDIVVVPDMRKGRVDIARKAPSDSFLTAPGQIPPWMRSDRDALPVLRWRDATSPQDLGDYAARWIEEVKEQSSAEMRRLVYVAVTRPRHKLLLSGFWYGDEEHAEKQLQHFASGNSYYTVGISEFLTEMGDLPAIRIAPHSRMDNSEPPPLDLVQSVTPETSIQDERTWPNGVQRRRGKPGSVGLRELEPPSTERLTLDEIAAKIERLESTGLRNWLGSVVEDLDVLLRARQREVTAQRPTHVTATDIVLMAGDPDEFAINAARPIPHEPTRAAAAGTVIHERIARHFMRPRGLDIEEVEDLGAFADDVNVETKMARFEALNINPADVLHIEHPVDVVIGGVTVRGTIDAILTDHSTPGGLILVDWKSGRRPDANVRQARALQLEVYRIGWARVTGTPLESIRTRFVYLGEANPERQIWDVPPRTEEEVERDVRANLEGSYSALDAIIWRE